MYLLTIRTTNKLGIKFEASVHLDWLMESLSNSPIGTQGFEKLRGTCHGGECLGKDALVSSKGLDLRKRGLGWARRKTGWGWEIGKQADPSPM